MIVWLAVALVVALAWIHGYTRGRSSPIAALAFLLAGPLLGLVLLLIQAANPPRNWGTFFGLWPAEFALACALAGLFAAVCAGGVHAVTIADEMRAYRKDPGAPASRPMASAALNALGLNAFASLEDVERAYRARAMELHPDHGGDPAQFKRLQKHYERAKKQVRRGGTTGARTG